MHPSILSLLVFTAAAAALAGNAISQNDECSGALPVVQGANGPYTNVGANSSLPAWACGPGGADLWFVYLAPAAGSLTVDTCGSGFDTMIEVFDGSCGGASLACNDDSCSTQSSVTVTVAMCNAYYIRVGGYDGVTGAFTLNVDGPAGAPCGTLASVIEHGPGCGARFASLYELQSAASFDMSGLTLTMTHAPGGGYVTTIGPGTLNPVGSLGTPTALVLGDDSEATAGLLGLSIGSNCWVARAAGNSLGFTPNVATMLANPEAAYYSWKDLNPLISGSGQVQYEESGTVAQITYDGVWVYAGTSAADAAYVQFVIDTANGDTTITWGALPSAGTDWLVGYSQAGASLDPGATDLSAIPGAGIATPAVDVPPLSLTSVGRPVQGSTLAQFQLTTSNVPAGALIHVGLLGVSQPDIPLVVIDMPGCVLNSSLDVLVGTTLLPPSTFTWNALDLPALPPNFSGFAFNAQSVVFGTDFNVAFGGLGALTSNGLAMTIGDL